MYRLVYFQVDRAARSRTDLPAPLRKSSVLSAVFRVGPVSDVTGAPADYALRLMVEPERQAATTRATWESEAGSHPHGLSRRDRASRTERLRRAAAANAWENDDASGAVGRPEGRRVQRGRPPAQTPRAWL